MAVGELGVAVALLAKSRGGFTVSVTVSVRKVGVIDTSCGWQSIFDWGDG